MRSGVCAHAVETNRIESSERVHGRSLAPHLVRSHEPAAKTPQQRGAIRSCCTPACFRALLGSPNRKVGIVLFAYMGSPLIDPANLGSRGTTRQIRLHSSTR